MYTQLIFFLFLFFIFFYEMHDAKFSSDKDDPLDLEMSLPIENKRSSTALEEITVLNLMNKFSVAWYNTLFVY